MKIKTVVALALAAFAFSSSAQETGFDFKLSGGGIVVVNNAGKDKLEPFAEVGIVVPLLKTATVASPMMLVDLKLAALPGEAVSIENPETFRSADFTIAVEQPLPFVAFSVLAKAGFSTRLTGSNEPLDRAARWGGVGLAMRSSRGPFISALLAADQRLSTSSEAVDGALPYRATLTVEGEAPIASRGEGKGPAVSVIGQAVLGIGRRCLGSASETCGAAKRDFVLVGVKLGI